MSTREVRSFDYVNHPYERVRAALRADAPRLFAIATRSAAERAGSVASELRVELGGIRVGAEVTISVDRIEEDAAGPASSRVTRIHLAWAAAHRPRLFPLMDAQLSVYPLTSTETQLDFAGRYDPPLGPLGDALDAVVGHRIAEASVHRFLADVAQHLREALAERPG
jgi:hypothetical protein